MKIAIIGAGVMGNGIAQVCAMSGHETLVYDIAEASLSKAEERIRKNLEKGISLGKIPEEALEQSMSRLQFTTEIEDLKVDMVIEAIVEKLEVKTQVFAQLEAINGPDCIYASNTSSIPLTQLASKSKYPSQIVGIHFFNPAHIMKLVEVIKAEQTSEAVLDQAVAFVQSVGKECIIAADAPGFIVNRVARHFYVEGLKILEENVADHEVIDELVQSSGFKMGPFRLMDLIGVETNLSVTTSMYELFNYDQKFRPNRLQQKKAQAGYFGRKSGKGFYEYE
jgi:3-hydroxybutyryl-CoA dehydrogenase